MPTMTRSPQLVTRERSYAPTGAIGKKLQQAQILQAQIQLLESELKTLRSDLLQHMEDNKLNKMFSGDVRLTRKIRHNWTYSENTRREIFALGQTQKWEQSQGIAQDRPLAYVALTTIPQPGAMSTTTTAPLTHIQLHRTWVAIERNGGGFCERLARAWFHGDDRNKARLNTAFEHLITEFGPGSCWYVDRDL